MGTVADIRKLRRDVVLPHLKAIEAQVHALDKMIDFTLDLLLARLKTLAKSVAASTATITHATGTHALDIDLRLQKIQNERATRLHEICLERTA